MAWIISEWKRATVVLYCLPKSFGDVSFEEMIPYGLSVAGVVCGASPVYRWI